MKKIWLLSLAVFLAFAVLGEETAVTVKESAPAAASVTVTTIEPKAPVASATNVVVMTVKKEEAEPVATVTPKDASENEAETPEELTEEQIKRAARLAAIREHRWDKIYLTMPFAEATNVCSDCKSLPLPQDNVLTTRGYILSAYDDFSGSTNKNILVARKLYFDPDGKLVAFEHIFEGCTVDQKNYVMNTFSSKYNMTPMQSKDFSWYKVTDGVGLVVECVESRTKLNIYGWQTPDEYTIEALFYLERDFVKLVNRHSLGLLPPEIAHP